MPSRLHMFQFMLHTQPQTFDIDIKDPVVHVNRPAHKHRHIVLYTRIVHSDMYVTLLVDGRVHHYFDSAFISQVTINHHRFDTSIGD